MSLSWPGCRGPSPARSVHLGTYPTTSFGHRHQERKESYLGTRACNLPSPFRRCCVSPDTRPAYWVRGRLPSPFNSPHGPGAGQTPHTRRSVCGRSPEQLRLISLFQEPYEETAALPLFTEKETTGLSNFAKVTKLVKTRTRTDTRRADSRAQALHCSGLAACDGSDVTTPGHRVAQASPLPPRDTFACRTGGLRLAPSRWTARLSLRTRDVQAAPRRSRAGPTSAVPQTRNLVTEQEMKLTSSNRFLGQTE